MALTKPQGNMLTKLGTLTATTSGTSKDFTGIPSGTTLIVISFNGVSLSGTSSVLVKLGDAGGFEDTGYAAISTLTGVPGQGSVVSSAGFPVAIASATRTLYGQLTLALMDAATFLWSAGQVGYVSVDATAPNDYALVGGGAKALSAELTQLRITTVNGTDTFDAGSINIAYF